MVAMKRRAKEEIQVGTVGLLGSAIGRETDGGVELSCGHPDQGYGRVRLTEEAAGELGRWLVEEASGRQAEESMGGDREPLELYGIEPWEGKLRVTVGRNSVAMVVTERGGDKALIYLTTGDALTLGRYLQREAGAAKKCGCGYSHKYEGQWYTRNGVLGEQDAEWHCPRCGEKLE